MSQIIPAASQIAETVGFTIKQDVYGLDVLTRPFEGPASDWTRFQAAYPDEVADTTYKDYFLVSRDAGSRRGEVITPVLTFKGVRGLSTGKFAISKAQRVKSLANKTVTLKMADASGRTIEIDYKAPSTVWKYAMSIEPGGSRYIGQIAPFREDFQFVRVRGAVGFPIIRLTGPIPIGEVALLEGRAYFYRMGIYTEEYTATQEGKAWTVTERNDGIIYQSEFIKVGGGA